MKFTEKTAVITGAGGVLCSSFAKALAKEGASVALLDLNQEAAEKVAQEIRSAGGVAQSFGADVLDREKLEEVRKAVIGAFGGCDILINGAGGNNIKAMTTHPHFDPAEISADKPEGMVGFFDLDLTEFQKVLLINTMGTVIPTRIFARQMAEAGEGTILNFASMNSYRPLTKVPAYAMSKAAVVNLTEWLATYLAPAKIRINAVAPGFFVNERSVKYLGSVETGLTPRGQSVISHTPMGRFGDPRDLLGTVSFLLDDRAAAFVTGITVPVDGGFLSESGI